MIAYSALPTPRRFHQSNEPLRILVGPTRSGTSTAALADVLIRAQEQLPGPDRIRRSRWAVVGPSASSIKADLLPLWQALVPVSAVDGNIASLNLQLGDQLVEAELHFLSASDITTIASLKITGAIISGDVDEAVLNALRAAVGLYPDEPTHSGIIIEGLYPDANGWLQTMIHSTPAGMAVFEQPAADSPQAENKQNLPPGYYEKLINDSPPDWLSRHIQPPAARMVRRIEILDMDGNVKMYAIVGDGNGFIETEYSRQERDAEDVARVMPPKSAKPIVKPESPTTVHNSSPRQFVVTKQDNPRVSALGPIERNDNHHELGPTGRRYSKSKPVNY